MSELTLSALADTRTGRAILGRIHRLVQRRRPAQPADPSTGPYGDQYLDRELAAKIRQLGDRHILAGGEYIPVEPHGPGDLPELGT